VFFDIVPAYWWMGLVAQFYLCYPWLWRLYQRCGATRATVVLCLSGWGGWLLLSLLGRLLPGSFLALADYLLYFNLPYRLPEFAIGMYLASRWKGATGTAAIDGRSVGCMVWTICGALIGLGLWGPSVSMLLVTQLYWVAVCLSLGLALFFTQTVAVLGAWRPMARAAAASYSFYLLHQPVISYSTPWIKTALPPFTAFMVVTAWAGIVSLLMSLALDNVLARLQTTPGMPR
jgi:peptidoglycan/LPS O-acetylase OafA/YrhL